MSSQKPKRPSARPVARPSTIPAAAVPEPQPQPPQVAPPAAPSAASTGSAKPVKKVRVSARRTTQPVSPSAPRPSARQGDAARKPPAARARKAQERDLRAKESAEVRKEEGRARAAPELPLGESSDRVRGEAPQEPRTNDAPVEAPHDAPTLDIPVVAPASTGAEELEAKESALEPELTADDDDIWREADAGPALPVLEDEGEGAQAEAWGERAEVTQVSRLARSRKDNARELPARFDSADVLSTEYYLRQYGAHGMRSLSAEVDDFGLDPHFEERARPWLEALCKRYFRVDVDGLSNLPAEGRVLMVCNRAGALPWDGLVLRTALRMAAPELQPVRWLAEDSVFHYPFLGVFMNRLGAVRACPENAERLLRQDRLVAVFPEGAHGSNKLFRDRYRLQRFGRGGYVKLALKLGAPIVPTAIIGSEETNPVLARSRLLGKVVGRESLPITPTFPWLGAAGLLPAPVKWRIVVGEPIDLSSYGPKSADDALLVHRLNEQIRGLLQSLVEQALGSRRSVLFG